MELCFKKTYLAVDELQIPRALRITVTSSVLGTGIVARVPGQATVGIHGDKVESSVQSAGQFGRIHINSEFLIEQLEYLISAIILHQEQTRANVRPSDEVQSEGIAIGGSTVSGGIVSTFQGAVFGTGLVIRAQRRIPLYSEAQLALPFIFYIREFLPHCQCSSWCNHRQSEANAS